MLQKLINWHFGDLSSSPNSLTYVVYSTFLSISNSMLFSGLTACYLFLLTDSDTTMVGISEGALGLVTLLPGIAGGFMADGKTGREKVIRYSGTGGLLGISLLLVSVTLCSDEQRKELIFYYVTASVGIVLLFESVGDAASEAILADSLKTGLRLPFYSSLQKWNMGCRCVGPAICSVVFLTYGDTWTESHIVPIIVLGCFMRVFMVAACFRFRDEKSLGAVSSAVSCAPNATEGRKRSVHHFVPACITVSNFFWSIGSGMTVKFFPIFLQSKLVLSPFTVMSIITIRPLLGIPSTTLLRHLSGKLGRVQAELFYWYIGIASSAGIVAMGYANRYNHEPLNRCVIIVLYLLRCVVLNSTGAVRRSIMMDFATKETRGRWSSLRRVTSLGWSGSAALGGYIISSHTYQLAFLVTSGFHLVSTFCKFPLLSIVPKVPVQIASFRCSLLLLLNVRMPFLSSRDVATLAAFGGLDDRTPANEKTCLL